jgi:hypothetical protein
MRLNVKILGGLECEVEAGPLDTVDHLKAEVESKLRLAKADQKLLFRGKPLQGTFLLHFWIIKNYGKC